MADTFDEIPDLFCYFNGAPGECIINKTGDNVDSLVSTLGTATNLTLSATTAGSNYIQHDGTTTVGLVPCFMGADINDDRGLYTTMASISRLNWTLAILEKKLNLTQGGTTSFGLTVNSNAIHALRTGPSVYQARVNGSNRTLSPEPSIDANDNVLILRVGASDGEADYHLNGVRHTCAGPASGTVSAVSLLCENGSEHSRSNIAIAVMYNRRLSDPEVAELDTLMKYWRDNGEAPGGAPPTTVTFGPVMTNDDPSVTSWSWEASADGGATWAGAQTILSNVSGETTTSLVVNSATNAEDQTQVRCRAISGKEPLGVLSAVATLTVQAAS
jgi:hypothetical protein